MDSNVTHIAHRDEPRVGTFQSVLTRRLERALQAFWSAAADRVDSMQFGANRETIVGRLTGARC